MKLDEQFWDMRYQNNDIGWDLAEISTPLKVYFDQQRKRWSLHGVIIGEFINQSTQTLRADIKAVTKHQYSLKEENGRWIARIVLDL